MPGYSSAGNLFRCLSTGHGGFQPPFRPPHISVSSATSYGMGKDGYENAIRNRAEFATPAHPARQQSQFSTTGTAAHFAKVPAIAPPGFYFHWTGAAIRE